MSPELPLLPLLTAVLVVLAGPTNQDGKGSGAPDGRGPRATRVSRPADATRRIYPGYAAISIDEPPRVPAALSTPWLGNGRLEPGYFILHFRSALSRKDEERLEQHLEPRSLDGRTAVRWHVPKDALVLWVADLPTLLALRRFERTDWIGRYEPGYKLDPALVIDAREDAPLFLAVELIPGHPPELVTRELEDLGARLLGEERGRHADDSHGVLVVEVLPRSVARLASVEGIRRLREHDESDRLHDGAHELDRATMPARHAQGATAAGRGRGSREKSSVPTTLTLAAREGWHSNDGTLAAADLERLRSADDSRLVLRDRARVTLGFERTVPPEAIVSALRLFVEHHEEARVQAGDVRWELGHGALTSPVVVQTTSAPLRSGESQEALDAWPPDGLVPDPNDLRIVIANDSQDDDTILDRVYVEVDYALPEVAPEITSTPEARAILEEAYRYDADGTAEASGTAPLAWSLVSGPADFTIDESTGEVRWTPRAVGSFPITIQAANAQGSVEQQFTVEVLPLPPTLLPTNAASIVYCPPERLALGPEKPQQRLNVFLPRGVPPPAGWPVVLGNRAGGGFPAKPLASLHDTGGTAPLHAFVASGVAVVDFGVSGVENGQGLFYPPGHASGRYESFAPADDNPEKDAEWAVQWLKTQGDFPLDARRICLRGSSHGAIISIWAAMGPERARASGSAQVRASTRVRAILALQPPTSVWAFAQGPDLGVRMVAHFEQQALPGVPAEAFGQVAERLQKDASVMGFAFDTEEARASNESQAICLVYNEPVTLVGGVPADLTLDAHGFPNLHDTLGPPFVHDSWAGHVFYRRLLGLSPRSAAFHGVFSRFAMRDTNALAAPFDAHTLTYSGGIKGSAANALGHEWVLQALGVTPSPLVTGSGSQDRAR